MMKIAVAPGDGIGPEICREAVKVLTAAAKKFDLEFEFNEYPVGWAAIDLHGHPLPEEIHAEIKKSDALLFGSIGLPGRDETLPQHLRPERACLLELRKGNYINLRPLWKPECMDGNAVDILIVRELNGGIYFGQPRGENSEGDSVTAFDTMVYSDFEIERICRAAFEQAASRNCGKRLCSVDKANVLASSALWRKVVTDIAADYPQVTLSHQLIDSACPLLITKPENFDVIVTGNMFGDIISDLGAVLCASLGMLPSASLGSKVGIYEPSHGSAPDIAGQDKANPMATILSAGMMMRYSFDRGDIADSIEDACTQVLADGYRTVDIASDECETVGCEKMGNLIAQRI